MKQMRIWDRSPSAISWRKIRAKAWIWWRGALFSSQHPLKIEFLPCCSEAKDSHGCDSSVVESHCSYWNLIDILNWCFSHFLYVMKNLNCFILLQNSPVTFSFSLDLYHPLTLTFWKSKYLCCLYNQKLIENPVGINHNLRFSFVHFPR